MGYGFGREHKYIHSSFSLTIQRALALFARMHIKASDKESHWFSLPLPHPDEHGETAVLWKNRPAFSEAYPFGVQPTEVREQVMGTNSLVTV